MDWIKKHKIISAVLGFIILSGIIGAVGGSGTTTKSENTNSNSTNNTNSGTNTQPTSSKPKEWTTVLEASGSSDKRTDTFTLQGGKTKLTYTFTGGEAIIGSIYVVAEGHSIEKEGGFPEVTVTKAGTDSTFLTKDAGNYYLDVKSANADWTIKIEEER